VLGATTIGFPGVSFTEGPGDTSHLGSGIVFLDDAAGSREVLANASRIEGWRRTAMHRICQEVIVTDALQTVDYANWAYPRVKQDFKHSLASSAIRGFDVNHQLWRLRNVKHMQDAEVELIMRTMVDTVQTYDQVAEVCYPLPAIWRRLDPQFLRRSFSP